jgi:hypothetical protein
MNVAASDDSSSLLPIGAAQRIEFGTRVVGSEVVSRALLGEFLAPADIIQPALLKIDVQGTELNVLKGCVEVLAKLSWVYVECSFVELYEGQVRASEVIEFLSNHGFHLIGVFNQTLGRHQRPLQADMLFAAR